MVSLAGEIDLANADAHADLLRALLDLTEASTVIVDCDDLTLLGSDAMSMMRRVHRHGAARGVDVVWVRLAARHRHTLQLTGLDRELHLDARRPVLRR